MTAIPCDPKLLLSLKNKYLLLDTNVFIDALIKPSVYRDFFNDLKKSDVTLVTIDLVKYEFLKGAANNEKYKEKEKFLNAIVEAVLPMTPKTFELVYSLIKSYGEDGKAPQMTDLVLGAFLMQFKKNIFLMTKDTTDFIQSIFDLPHIINVPHHKGIHTYGIYQYSQKESAPF